MKITIDKIDTALQQLDQARDLMRAAKHVLANHGETDIPVSLCMQAIDLIDSAESELNEIVGIMSEA